MVKLSITVDKHCAGSLFAVGVRLRTRLDGLGSPRALEDRLMPINNCQSLLHFSVTTPFINALMELLSTAT